MTREDRYIVVKKSHLTADQLSKLKSYMHLANIGTVPGVVVEADWPEYETVWRMIEDRVTARTAASQASDAGDRLGGLEWTEDGYSLRTPFDGDVDGDGRHVVVGGEIVVTFADSDVADEYRSRILATLTAPPTSDAGEAVTIPADHPLAKGLRTSQKALDEITRQEQANIGGYLALRDYPIGSASPPTSGEEMRLREALPRLDDGLIEAAMLAHYGKRASNLGINGVDLTANDTNWTFRDGFKRMWAGVRKELNRRAALTKGAE